MRIGGSISFQLVDIFNIMESSLSDEEKRKQIEVYQDSLKVKGIGIQIAEEGKNGQNMKNGFYIFGNLDELSYDDLLNVKKYVDEDLSSLTCEGEMKMSNIIRGYDSEKQDIIYKFDLSDKVYKYAMEHGKAMRGHTLVWHKHEPKAILDKYIEDRIGVSLDEYKIEHSEEFFEKRKELTKEFLASYMKKMGEQYPGCYCWDVLNEIVPELETGRPTEKERKDGLRHSMWYEYLGEEFYIDILEIARENLPEGTKLFYNEFGEQHPEKRKAILAVIGKIKEYEEKTGKTILDGIGLQSHYDLNITQNQIEEIHTEFAKTGKEVQVTEIDIMPGRDEHGNVREFDQETFESLWKKVFECAEKYGIQAFTGWGVGDELNWFSNIGAIPTMVDKNGNVKEFEKEFIESSRHISMKDVITNALGNCQIAKEHVDNIQQNTKEEKSIEGVTINE